ncbi:MAG: hypothetical protein PHD81_02270 [Candidatus Nanoarchaeia archaeon]|nr:hypothetical protein [Candidatus Nanoarchaeia archaeon]MDD5587913.1 hypothetical protein [Candidatus Nanoarchaeia archaeon]
MEKRGQVTIYLIFGFVILILVISAFFVRQYIIQSNIDINIAGTGTVPEQAVPIKTYIDSCVYDITKQAIITLGMQGGYIQLPRDDLPVTPMTPFSNRLESFPGLYTAYWFYETSNGIQQEQIPTIESMEKEIGDYVSNNLAECIDGLNQFTNQGYSFTINTNAKSEVSILDDSVTVSITMPVNLSIKNINFNLKEHQAKVDVPLGRMYKVSSGIMKQQRTNFFEEKTIDMLVAYENIPFSGTSFDCKPEFWSKQETINNLKEALSINTPAYKVKGSRFTEINSDSEYFLIDSETPATGLDINFMYSKRWPMIVEIVPSDGDILKSDSLTQKLSDYAGPIAYLVCIYNYNFIYDIKYPLLVTLTDTAVLDGQGYTFQFASEVIIDNNQPKKNIYGTYDQPELQAEICKNPSTKIDVYTFAPDNYGNTIPLKEANINFKCFTTQCEMGTTNQDAYLSGLFPPCINGAIIAEKEGYYKAKQTVSTNQEKSISLILESIYKITPTVKLIDKNTGQIREPYDSETVIFELKNMDNDFSTSFSYSIKEPSEPIDLIPGRYEIKSYIMGSSTWPIKIQGGDIEKCIKIPKTTLWNVFGSEEQCFTTKIEDITVDQAIKGGAEFEFEIEREKITSKNIMTFYTVVDQFPSNYESLNLVYNSIQENAGLPLFKYPE